jgi:hypothetical protein
MTRSLGEAKEVLFCSGQTLGLASLVAIAGGALALCAGASAQVLQKAMTWISVPWFGACCLACRWRRRQHVMNRG